jgi:hypothetical protein
MRAKKSRNINLMWLSEQFLELLSVFKEVSKNFVLIFFSLTRQARNLKNICACTENTNLIDCTRNVIQYCKCLTENFAGFFGNNGFVTWHFVLSFSALCDHFAMDYFSSPTPIYQWLPAVSTGPQVRTTLL